MAGTAFGHFFVEPLIFLILRKKKNNLFFFTENIITNYFFYSFLKRKIKIDNKLKYFINILKFLKLKNFKFYDLGSYLEEKHSINLNNSYQKLFYKQSKIKIKFNSNEKKVINNFLKINKIDLKRNKFVVIASRDNDYKKKLFNSKYFEQNFRNFKFNNLKKIIFDLNQKGIKVIRIAQFSKPIKYIKHKNFIDLNNINKNEDVLYFWLIKNSYFFIGSASGPLHVAQFFKKKIFCINAIPYRVIFEMYNTMILPKKIKYLNNTLSIRDVLDKKIDDTYDFTRNKLFKKFKYLENTPIELFSGYQEFLKIFFPKKLKNFLRIKLNKKMSYYLDKKNLSSFKNSKNVIPNVFFKKTA